MAAGVSDRAARGGTTLSAVRALRAARRALRATSHAAYGLAFATVAYTATLQPARAQVAFHPATTTPAAWERFAARVVNATGDPTVVEVRVDVPGAVVVLGVEPVPGWEAMQIAGTDSTPHRIVWRGGTVRSGELHEFAFLGRVAGDASRATLVFPVTLTRANGGPEQIHQGRVAIQGATRLSTRGALAVAATALGLALVALMVALSRRAPTRGE